MASRSKLATLTGAIFMLLGVILGAIGAHALEKAGLDADSLNSYETAVRYQIYHGLALLILAQSKYLNTGSFRFLLVGTLLFSISIYILALDELLGVNASFLGPVTPIGGAFLILGWGLLIINIVREKSTN